MDVADLDGFTPLHLAIEQGNLAILAKGVNLNAATANGCTPLHLAAYDGDLALLNLLLEKGADPTITDHSACTPLHIAAYRGHLYIISRLLLCNIDINAQDDHGNTFLHKNKIVDNERLISEERLYRFMEAMQGIENKHYGLLRSLVEVMDGYCPELTNEDGQTILAMMLDYMQGVALPLSNQDGQSTLAMVSSVLALSNDQNYEEVVKILDRHQQLGDWIRSHTQKSKLTKTI